MRRFAVSLLLLAALGGACAEDSESAVAADSQAGVTSSTETVDPSPTTPMATGKPGTGLILTYADADEDGMSLAVTYRHGIAPCSTFEELMVEEAADQVTLTVVTTERTYPDGSVCPDLATDGATEVVLGAPLGTRTVVEGLPRDEVTSNVWCREALREDVHHAQAVPQGVP